MSYQVKNMKLILIV